MNSDNDTQQAQTAWANFFQRHRQPNLTTQSGSIQVEQNSNGQAHNILTLDNQTVNTTNQEPNDTSPRSTLAQAQHSWRQLFASRQQSNDLQHQPQNTSRPISLTAENMRTNGAWGDTLSLKDATVTRIYALNVNGLTLDQRGGQFDTLCSQIQADIICCQERNIDTTNPQVKTILHTTIRNHWQRSRLMYGTSPTPFHSFYKPGGTMMMTVNNLSGRVV